jgi:hypothetical protein
MVMAMALDLSGTNDVCFGGNLVQKKILLIKRLLIDNPAYWSVLLIRGAMSGA